MSPEETALAWARARSGGPLPSQPGAPVPAGMIRLAEPDGSARPAAWLVPQVPESADARVLAELGLAGPLLEQPNDTARMLAACLRCCWADPLQPPWPGQPAAPAGVLAVFRDLTGPRDEAAHRRSAVGALRRLGQAGWVLRDEAAGTIRLGPRVALWTTSDLSVLRQLWRSISPPERDGALPPAQPGPATAASPDGPADNEPGDRPEDEPGDGPDGGPAEEQR
ncbi:MAG TPA: hypothetical protein VGN41_10050 [Streptosporangiaceae bacterium]